MIISYAKLPSAIAVQPWTGPEGSRKLRLPDLSALRTDRIYPPTEIFLVLISVTGWVNPRGHSAAEGLCQLKTHHWESNLRPSDL